MSPIRPCLWSASLPNEKRPVRYHCGWVNVSLPHGGENPLEALVLFRTSLWWVSLGKARNVAGVIWGWGTDPREKLAYDR